MKLKLESTEITVSLDGKFEDFEFACIPAADTGDFDML